MKNPWDRSHDIRIVGAIEFHEICPERRDKEVAVPSKRDYYLQVLEFWEPHPKGNSLFT